MHAKVTRRTFLCCAMAGLPIAAHAQSDWRTELGTFRMGMLDSEAVKLSPGELERIRAAYADALKMPTEIMRARDLPALVDALVSGRVDYAMLTAAAYASAYLACNCIEPVANAVMADSSNGTRAVLVLADTVSLGGVSSSKGIAIPGRDAFNSYGVALAGLPAALPLFAPDAAFVVDSKTLEAAVAGFAAGKVDGVIGTVPDNRKPGAELVAGDAFADELLKSGHKVKVAWFSEPVPNGPHAVRQNLAAEAKTILATYLEGLAAADPDLNDMLLPEGAISFRRIGHPAYATALKAAAALAGSAAKPAP